MKPTLQSKDITLIRNKLKTANIKFVKNYPGESPNRQPVHTVYGGAQIFTFDVAQKLSQGAIKSLSSFAPNAQELCEALGENYGDGKLWNTIFERVKKKLEVEAVEDFRIDFEDGYGNRPDEEEDGHAQSCAEEGLKGMKENTLPPFIG